MVFRTLVGQVFNVILLFQLPLNAGDFLAIYKTGFSKRNIVT